MSAQQASTARAKGKEQEEALQDLKRFITGQSEQLPPEVQQDSILEQLFSIMDDELIKSLEVVMEDALWRHGDEVDGETMQTYWPTKSLLNRLRDLQKARLRDALERTMRFANS